MAINDQDPWKRGFKAGINAGRSETSSITPAPLVYNPTADAARARKALRDEFAKAALIGQLSTADHNHAFPPEAIAAGCYTIADCMLSERDKAE